MYDIIYNIYRKWYLPTPKEAKKKEVYRATLEKELTKLLK